MNDAVDEDLDANPIVYAMTGPRYTVLGAVYRDSAQRECETVVVPVLAGGDTLDTCVIAMPGCVEGESSLEDSLDANGLIPFAVEARMENRVASARRVGGAFVTVPVVLTEISTALLQGLVRGQELQADVGFTAPSLRNTIVLPTAQSLVDAALSLYPHYGGDAGAAFLTAGLVSLSGLWLGLIFRRRVSSISVADRKKLAG
jgi:hypothetical protein